MKHDKPINETHDLIRRMGGFTSVAKRMESITGIHMTRQATHWWVTRNRIPRMWKAYLSMAYPSFAPEIQKNGIE